MDTLALTTPDRQARQWAYLEARLEEELARMEVMLEHVDSSKRLRKRQEVLTGVYKYVVGHSYHTGYDKLNVRMRDLTRSKQEGKQEAARLVLTYLKEF